MPELNTTGTVPQAPGRGALRVSLLNWAAWTPGLETRSAWCAWAGRPCAAERGPAGSALPMMLRRRLTPFGQRLVQVASECSAGLPPARYILSTRHGELVRAARVLDAIEADGMPSPTDFSLSIHHALIGLLSIHTGNRLGHTALSAGWDSFGSGLIEAAACIAESPQEPVLLVHADDKLPDEYADFREGDDAVLPLVLAFAFGAPVQEGMRVIEIQLAPPNPEVAPSPAPGLDFLRFILSEEHVGRANGLRMQWNWRRDG